MFGFVARLAQAPAVIVVVRASSRSRGRGCRPLLTGPCDRETIALDRDGMDDSDRFARKPARLSVADRDGHRLPASQTGETEDHIAVSDCRRRLSRFPIVRQPALNEGASGV